jgi:hypothetical protein
MAVNIAVVVRPNNCTSIITFSRKGNRALSTEFGNENPDPALSNTNETYSYNVSVGTAFLNRIEEHLHLLSLKNKKRVTKKDWVVQALTEKLRQEEGRSLAARRSKSLAVRIPKYLLDQVGEKIKVLKGLGKTYSKKRYILEALEEQISREQASLNIWENSLRGDKS